MESNQANTARIEALEEDAQDLKQIIRTVDKKVVIGSGNTFLVLEAVNGLEVNSENFTLDKEGNLVIQGELNLLSGRINSENGLLELDPGESDEEEESQVMVKGDVMRVEGNLEVGGEITNISTGTGVIKAGEKDTVIENEGVTEDSFIGITPLSSTFIYLSEVEKESFTVSALEEVSEDTEFNWWIIKAGGEKESED